MMNYKLRFDAGTLGQWASRYTGAQSDNDRDIEDRIVKIISPEIHKRGYYERDEFLEICRWKTTRSLKLCQQNDAEFIREATSIAMSAESDRLRVHSLRALDGVEWPTASVLLHFGHKDRYPILDFRALWSLSLAKQSSYSFDFWIGYVQVCRDLADKHSVSMRTLDRALWQYSKENQKS